MPANNISIPLPDCFSFEECVWFLNRNYDDCMHSILDREIRKAIMLDGKVLLLSITENNGQLAVELLNGKMGNKTAAGIVSYVSEWLDLELDLTPFYRLLKKEPALRYMAKDFYGLRLISIPDLFEALCWSVIGQQINLSFAYKLKRRLVERFGTKLTFDGIDYYLFPDPASLAQASVEELRSMQFSGSKANYIISVATAFSEGRMSKDVLLALPGMESKQKALIALKGVGIWTANYVLMKTMRESGGIPHGDVGLLNALSNHGLISARTETHRIDQLFSRFAGWESYLVFYLWRSLAVKKD